MLTKNDMQMLKRLSIQILAAPLLSEDEIYRIQRLVDMGFARDFSSFHGHRIPIRLRIWGINDAGRAVVEQEDMTAKKKSNQLNLTVKDGELKC